MKLFNARINLPGSCIFVLDTVTVSRLTFAFSIPSNISILFNALFVMKSVNDIFNVSFIPVTSIKF